MKILYKLSIIVLSFFCVNIVVAKSADNVITIASSPTPHAQLLAQMANILKKDGIILEVRQFSDYIQPNMVVAQNQMDANFFQHAPYLNEFNKIRGTHLVPLVGVHIEPMGMYADADYSSFVKAKSLKNFPHDVKIGIPSDPTNEGRALKLLSDNGLIKLKSGVSMPTKMDVVTNQFGVKFIELDAAMLPRMIISKQLDFAVINANYALGANLNPLKDSIIIENKDSMYVNIIAVRSDELTKPKIRKLEKVAHDPQIKNYILNTYKGAIVPAF